MTIKMKAGAVIAVLLAALLLFYKTGGDGRLVLEDIDGVRYGALDDAETNATVLLFMGAMCPISNQYAPEISSICDDYRSRGAECYLVFPEQGLTPQAAREHVSGYGLRFPAILDPDHRLTAKAGATITPEAAVFSREGALLYRGRIDDRHVDFGKSRRQAQRRDLRDALEAITEGRPVQIERTEAVGCFIEPIR